MPFTPETSRAANAKRRNIPRNEHGQFMGPAERAAYARRVRSMDREATSHDFRRAIRDAVTYADVVAITKVIVRAAKKGNLAAAREIFDRLGGKPTQAVEVTERSLSPEEAESQLRQLLTSDPDIARIMADSVGMRVEGAQVVVSQEVAGTIGGPDEAAGGGPPNA